MLVLLTKRHGKNTHLLYMLYLVAFELIYLDDTIPNTLVVYLLSSLITFISIILKRMMLYLLRTNVINVETRRKKTQHLLYFVLNCFKVS